MAHLRHWACLKNAHLRLVNSAFSACDPLPYLHHSDKKLGRTDNEVVQPILTRNSVVQIMKLANPF